MPPLVPAHAAQAEISVLRSRFIAAIAYTPDLSTAKAHLAAVRATLNTASHHVPAWIIGHGSSTIEHCSDAGEPAGTAGRPVLAVLKGSGLGDVCIVVTRYFGGTKLGTGGLVQAYTAAAQAVLAQTPLAHKISTQRVELRVAYPDYQLTQQLITTHNGSVLDSIFAADVTLTLRFPANNCVPFQHALREQSHGRYQATLLGADEFALIACDENKRQP